MSKFIDLTGQRFGRLTVIKQVPPPDGRKGQRWWLCKCDCGNEVIVNTGHLTSKHTKSCGCLTRDRSKEEHPNFKGNQYIIDSNGNYIGIDSNNQRFIISSCDYEEVSKYCWTALIKTNRQAIGGAYFSARMSRKSTEGHKAKMLQNFIWELHNPKLQKNEIVDHINRLPNDCRLENLRVVNKSGNAYNSISKRKSNVNIVGVSYSSKKNRWRAYINANGKRIELGYFLKKEEAIIARLKAELQYWNEICPGNLLIYEEYKEKLYDNQRHV